MTAPAPDFSALVVGDSVVRWLAGEVPMVLRVTDLTPTLIVCGDWTFDRATGLEIDHGLSWGPEYGVSGSYLRWPA